MIRKGSSKKFFRWMIAYFILLTVVVFVVRNELAPGFEIPLALIPLAPAVFIVLAVRGGIASLDELQRKVQLEALAIAFAATFLVLVSSSLLGIAGIPEFEAGYVILLMSAFWVGGQLMARRTYK
jgi:hypothetical protein